MTSTLDIHPASPDERLAAYRNVHDVWSGGLSVEEHLQRRLASVQHNRARWFVGCVEGEVVASLATYDLRFRLHGQSLAGFSIGSVHTLASHRGRGFAPQLIDWVERYLQQQGAAVSMLYSDIDPAYYARLGYQLCPANQGWCEASDLVGSNHTLQLQTFSPADHWQTMAEVYRGCHETSLLAIERPAEYWHFLIRKWDRDEFFWVVDRGREVGYVRLTSHGDSVRISDWALLDDDESLVSRMYPAVIRLAQQRGAARVGGWLPDRPAARQHFQLSPRTMEITMVKPLAACQPLDEAARLAADRFCEIDHV